MRPVSGSVYWPSLASGRGPAIPPPLTTLAPLCAEAPWRTGEDEIPVGICPRLVQRPRFDGQQQSAPHRKLQRPIDVGAGMQDVVCDYRGQLSYVLYYRSIAPVRVISNDQWWPHGLLDQKDVVPDPEFVL